jgi:hypothetical protein
MVGYLLFIYKNNPSAKAEGLSFNYLSFFIGLTKTNERTSDTA